MVSQLPELLMGVMLGDSHSDLGLVPRVPRLLWAMASTSRIQQVVLASQMASDKVLPAPAPSCATWNLRCCEQQVVGLCIHHGSWHVLGGHSLGRCWLEDVVPRP